MKGVKVINDEKCGACKYFYETDSGEYICLENWCIFEEKEERSYEEANLQADAE